MVLQQEVNFVNTKECEIKTMYCFLDMDGVLVDFVGGVCKAHNKPFPYNDPQNHNIFSLEDVWKISSEEVWKPCDGPTFWEDLEETPEAKNLVKAVTSTFGVENTAILTAPSQSPYCVPGKRKWIKKHFPQLQKNIIFTSAKKFLAAPGRLLIDDRNENVDEFRNGGGSAILMPRLWNRFHQVVKVNKELDMVKIQIELFEEMSC